jgi:hypothetical protein
VSGRDGSAAARLKLWLSWLFVGVPLAWGVAQVAAKSMALFS